MLVVDVSLYAALKLYTASPFEFKFTVTEFDSEIKEEHYKILLLPLSASSLGIMEF
jgi:hypothetical protein